MELFSNCGRVHAQKPRRQAQVGITYTRGLRSRQAGSADPDAYLQHPESRTRGLPRRQSAENSRGLRSRQAGSADPDARSLHPKSRTRGLPRRQPAENSRGLRSRQAGSADPDAYLQHPKSWTRGLHDITTMEEKRKTNKGREISTRLDAQAGQKFGG